MAWAIKFGTDGWRGIIGEDFNFNNCLRVAKGLHSFLAQKQKKSPAKIVVGYDCRFLSKESAEIVAGWLFEQGHEVILADAPVASPAVSLSVKELNFDAGVMITASHNPPVYNGIKFKAAYGGSFTEEMVQSLAPFVPDESPAATFNVSPTHWVKGLRDKIKRDDLNARHLRALTDFVSVSSLKGLHFMVDSMHGSGRIVLRTALENLGAKVTEIRSEINPSFGGTPPEPLDSNTQEMRQLILSHKAQGGFALDGDADRIAARDEHGDFLDSHRIFSLMLSHLIQKRKMRGPVVKTISVTDMVDQLCKRHELPLTIVPIGFKNICALMVKDPTIVMGGEESGGIGVCSYLPERDGALCALLLAEIVATSNGKGLGATFDELQRSVGPRYFRRLDQATAPGMAPTIVQRLREQPPERIGGQSIAELITLDGIKFRLKDRWLMLRGSGTEPLLRIYAEAPSPQEAERLLEEGARLVERQ